MSKRKTKWLIVAAVITVFTLFSLLTVANAATEGSVVRFFMGGREIEGDYNDYVDREGFRHITFNAVIPIDADNFAVIYDVDRPWGENVRVITEEADPDLMERLRLYHEGIFETYVEPEDFGLVFKSNELCIYSCAEGLYKDGVSFIGGDFMHERAAYGMPAEKSESFHFDWENGTKILKETICYYVGKE